LPEVSRLGGLARLLQQAKGKLYLRALMLDGTRKSMRPMAARLGVDQLQEFVTSDVGFRRCHQAAHEG